MNEKSISQQIIKKCQANFIIKDEVYVSGVKLDDISSDHNVSELIILSSAGFYKFHINNDDIVYDSSHSILSLKKIFYKEPNQLSLFFEDGKFEFQTQDAFSFAISILTHYSIIYFKVNSIDLILESEPENFLQYKILPKRPSNLLQTRCTAFSHHFKTKFNLANLKVIKEWDRSTQGSLTLEQTPERISNLHVFAKPLGWDAKIHSLVFKNFFPEYIASFASDVVSNSVSLRILHFNSYKSQFQDEFNFIQGPQCRLDTIVVGSCHEMFLLKVIQGFQKYSLRMKQVAISDCSLSAENTVPLFNCLQTFQCFQLLKNLTLENCNFEQINAEIFDNFVKTHISLYEIHFKSIEGDISKHVKSLTQHPRISLIELDSCNLQEYSSMDPANESLTTILIRDCKVSYDAFKCIAASLLIKKRSKLAVFGFQTFLSSDLGIGYINALLELNPQPNLIEFDFHGVGIDSNSINQFIKFLKTQTFLSYIGFKGCFRKNLNQNLPILAEYIVSSKITGIDCSSDKLRGTPQSYIDFVNAICAAKRLSSVILANCRLGDNGAQALIKLSRELPCLEEICLDNIELSTKNAFISLYSRLTEIPSLRSIATPKTEIAQFDLLNDPSPITKKLIAHLKRMNAPKNFFGRLRVYEKNGFTYNETAKQAQIERNLLKLEEGEIEFGEKLNAIDKIMEKMVNTIEEGVRENPFDMCMEIIKGIKTRRILNQDHDDVELDAFMAQQDQDAEGDEFITS